MRRHIPLIIALALVVLGLSGLVQSAQAQDWRFAIEEIQGSVQDAYAQKFKELLEEKSEGKITVSVFPYGTLGTSAELTELVQQGAIQFANASPGHLGSLVPEIQVFSIPYLLSQNDEVNRKILTESETIYEDLGQQLEKRGLQLLTMYTEGEMVWTADKEIRKPEDFKGFKMRTMVSPMLIEAYRAYGADPTPLPYGEVYGGLQLGIIDGQVNPVFAIEEMNFYEVQDYLIFPGEQQFTTTVVTNLDWYSGLSDDQQQMIQEAIAEATDHIFEVQRQYNQERLETIKEKKPGIEVIHLTPEEQEAFRERSMAVRERFVQMTGLEGKEILKSLSEEIAQTEEEMGSN